MPTNSVAPRVFTCHASEDKERFVIPFAVRLRSIGIDAWVDQWEIGPGDSIVRKIFDDGLENADAAIIVISRFSIKKPWVREELDSAFVARIERKLRIIPLVIEDCDIPPPLKHLRYIRVRDILDFEKEIDEIARALFNNSAKPPLGPPPTYARIPTLEIPGLTHTDCLVLEVMGDQFIERGHPQVERAKIGEKMSGLGISPQALEESLEVLAEEHYIEAKRASSGKFLLMKLNWHTVDMILKLRCPGYKTIERQIATYICNNTKCNNKYILETLSVPIAMVNHVIEDLARQNLIKTYGQTVNGEISILGISARLKRLLTG